jgi:hypothetical protein
MATATASPFDPTATANDPTLANDVSGLNQAQSDYQAQSKALSDQLNQFTSGQQQTIAGAYGTAAQQTGLQGLQDTYNTLDSSYIKAAGQANAAPVNAVLDSAGHDVMSSTAASAGTANALVPGLTASNDALALAPAENAMNTAQQNTNQISQQIVSGAQLAEQGFTSGMDAQLQALQSKIDSQQTLTGDEYNAYVGLTTAKTQAAASVQAANITAGATEQNTASTNALNKYLAELENPGASVNSNGVGSVNLAAALSGGQPSSAPEGPLLPGQSLSSPSTSSINQLLAKYGL